MTASLIPRPDEPLFHVWYLVASTPSARIVEERFGTWEECRACVASCRAVRRPVVWGRGITWQCAWAPPPIGDDVGELVAAGVIDEATGKRIVAHRLKEMAERMAEIRR